MSGRARVLRSLPGLNPRIVQTIEYLLESVLIFDKLLLRRLSHLGLVIVDPITKLPEARKRHSVIDPEFPKGEPRAPSRHDCGQTSSSE